MQCREAFCALEFYSDEQICNAWIQVSFHKYTLFIMYTINTIGTWRYWQPLIPHNIITSTSLMFIPRTLPRCSLLRRPSPSMPSDGSTQACGPFPQSLSRGCTELQCAPLYRLLPPGMCHSLLTVLEDKHVSGRAKCSFSSIYWSSGSIWCLSQCTSIQRWSAEQN